LIHVKILMACQKTSKDDAAYQFLEVVVDIDFCRFFMDHLNLMTLELNLTFTIL